MIKRSVLYMFLLTVCVSLSSFANEQIKVAIIDGRNNHPWQETTPWMKMVLEETELFDVDVITAPPRGESLDDFKPPFSDYCVLLMNYNDGQLWPEETRNALVEYMKGGGGMVIVHAADNAFGRWDEYNRMIGLGGWGGRNHESGPRVIWKDGEVYRDYSEGRAGAHGRIHAFQVVNRDTEHPITKGLPEKWMQGKDELYDRLRGPAENLTLLSTAFSCPETGGTGDHEPVLFTVDYGEGRVFHSVLGHNVRHGMSSEGFIVTLQRGTEWAATGDVTQSVPESFPGPDELSIRDI